MNSVKDRTSTNSMAADSFGYANLGVAGQGSLLSRDLGEVPASEGRQWGKKVWESAQERTADSLQGGDSTNQAFPIANCGEGGIKSLSALLANTSTFDMKPNIYRNMERGG